MRAWATPTMTTVGTLETVDGRLRQIASRLWMLKSKSGGCWPEDESGDVSQCCAGLDVWAGVVDVGCGGKRSSTMASDSSASSELDAVGRWQALQRPDQARN